MTFATRAAFLTAGAAALAGCARGVTGSLLPKLTPSTTGRAPAGTPAAPIPQHVLSLPILGEGRRFDGATAPPGWMKAEGQTLPLAQYSKLAAILGRGGSRDATTLLLPTSLMPLIIAVTGTDPADARAIAALRRGANMKLGVSVEGMTVSEPPLRLTVVPPPPAPVASWFPGTLPTPEQIDAARPSQAVYFAPAAQHYQGSPRALAP